MFVYSYDVEGHQIVADLAWRLLEVQNQTTTLRAIERILSESQTYYESQMNFICKDCATPLSSYAEWADDVKSFWSRWRWNLDNFRHYIFLFNSNAPRLRYMWDCGDDKCLVGSIVRNVINLHQESKSMDSYLVSGTNGQRSLARESLMYLIHLLGDLSQPLHSGQFQDMQGVLILANFREFVVQGWFCSWVPGIIAAYILNCTPNLHYMWDATFLDETIEDDFEGSLQAFEDSLWNEFLENQNTEVDVDSWVQCFVLDEIEDGRYNELELRNCVLEWANESLRLAMQYAYLKPDGKEIVSRAYLGDDYYERLLPILREELVKGAVRLANILKAVFEFS